MPREENLLVLKMLQDGTITAEQAAELLGALEASEARAASAAPVSPVPPVPAMPPVPPVPPSAPVPPVPTDFVGAPPPPPVPPAPEGEAFARARARIAAAREKVAGVQEQLTAAEEKLEQAQTTPTANPWEQMADALKDLPGAKSVADALRGVDPGRIAANARRQARRLGKQVRSSLNDMEININLNFADQVQGEPTLSAPREATTPVGAGSTLRVRNTLGDIEAIGADVPEARIAGVLKIWAADKAAAETIAGGITLVVEQAGDGPTVSVKYPGDRPRRVSLDLKVFVPQDGTRVSLFSLAGDVTARALRGGAVVLATQSGDAKASEIVGDVAVETASGDIAVEGVVGNISASSASGDIAAIRVSGQTFKATTQSGDVDLTDSTISTLTVETVSGDAQVAGVTGRSLRVRAVSGDTTFENTAFDDEIHCDTVSGSIAATPRGPLTTGTINLVTVSGDVDLTLPTATDAQLDITTKSGDAKAHLLGPDNTEREVTGGGMTRLSEAVGNGDGARITVSTLSGDVSAHQVSPVVEVV